MLTSVSAGPVLLSSSINDPSAARAGRDIEYNGLVANWALELLIKSKTRGRRTERLEMNSSVDSYAAYVARVSNETIPCYEPSVGAEEIALLTDVINRNWLSESKYTREFEKRLAAICERKYALAFSNATAAMITGMKSLGIGRGDEVIVPSFTHSADPNSIANAGAVPVFADVNEATLCLDVDTVDAVRTPKSKAILYVALYGNSSDLTALSNYARKHGLFLINDCAPALAGAFRGRKISSFGDFAALSFFADKTITTGEGGMLLTDNPDLLAECNIYKHDGRRERGVDVIERRGFNFRITELQAAIGVAQLDKLDYFIARKKEIFAAYEERLASVPYLRFFRFNPDCDAVPHRVLIFVPEAAALIEYLENAGIGVRTTFMPMHSQPCYGVEKSFPVTESLYATGVCLPSAPTLTQANIDYIADAIQRFYTKGKK
jgi:perosamine synthetase